MTTTTKPPTTFPDDTDDNPFAGPVKRSAICSQCAGQGLFGSGMDSHTGISNVDPCPDCTEKGICARCGKPGLTSEERGDDCTGQGPCTFCGWNYDTPVIDKYLPGPSSPWCAVCGGCIDQQDLEALQMGVACICDRGGEY